MSKHKLQKFYNSFGGLDTRSSKLTQDPDTVRAGSKNWKYNFQDEISNANGFQHSDDGGAFHSQGLAEYKYRDVSTGEEKSQLLGVNDDGILYRKRFFALKYTVSVPVVEVPYSFYYDEVLLKFVFKIEGIEFPIEETTTLDQLVTLVNAGTVFTTIDVVDENGTVTSSTELAYLGDVVIDKDVFILDSFHQVWYWERVLTPTINEVCFPVTAAFKDNPNYEGLSFVNSNNSCYITDGGFPIKYDGFAAYRMGMPRTAGNANGLSSSYDGFAILGATVVGSLLTLLATYKYVFQLGFVDPSGVEILGKTYDVLTEALVGGENAVSIAVPPIKNTDMFPVFACRVNGAVVLDNTNQVITVDAGHNISSGMVLRIPVDNAPTAFPGISFWYASVASTTATTITVVLPPNNNLRNIDSASFTVLDNQWINGGFTQELNENKITEPELTGGTYYLPPVLAGAFVRVFRSTANTDVINRLADIPLPLDNGLVSPGDKYTYIDELADSGVGGLSRVAYSQDDGDELPRACKYLSKFQDFIVQSGRTPDPSLANVLYPTTYSQAVGSWGITPPVSADFRTFYTEAALCDFQSIYWNDLDDVEGFPVNGLSEFLVQSPFNDKIKGMTPNKDVFVVFKQRTTSIIVGDLALGSVTQELLESAVGCGSHRTIQEVEGSLFWLDDDNGFYSMVAGRIPQYIGYRISDYFKINAQKLDYRKAVSANFRKENLYICAVGSTMFIFDYGNYGDKLRACWYLWDRIDTKAILETSDNQLIISDGDRLWKMKTTNTKYDFSDHTTAIPFVLNTAWLNQGQPMIDKTFQNLWINSIQGSFELDVDQFANYMEKLTSTYKCLTFKQESDCKLTVKENVNASIPKLSAISWGLRNEQVNEWVRIQGMELEYAPSYDQSEPKT